MVQIHLTAGISLLLLNSVAGLFGLYLLAKSQFESKLFWRLVRAGQAAVLIQVILGVLLLLLNHHPNESIHILYGVLPLAVSFLAEQLRIAAADHILAAQNIGSSEEVAQLPEAEQSLLVRRVMQREVLVMTLSALVIVILALRAAGTSAAF